MKVKNPILPGFYPDPSICEANGEYYLVCSSFELFPGIPIFKSKNLVEWQQIGHVMSDKETFYVEANTMTGGVMAPTIRYFNGHFYVINCNFSDKGNFIVKAENPEGPWSAPIWLDDVPGIDASLYIDEDGLAYIMGTGNVVERADGSFERGIYIAPFDLEAMKLMDKPKAIWDSALRNANSPEAPHIYKKDDYYYLVIAEGGTEHYHAVTIARSKTIDGWYEGNPANPIMSHRHLGYNAKIANVGHADFVVGPDDKWYAVMLGSRTIEGNYKNLGRETYICPIEWENDWPVLSPSTGLVEFEYDFKDITEKNGQQLKQKIEINESTKQLPLEMVFWGTPSQNLYRFNRNGLELDCLPRSITQPLRCLLDMDKEKDKPHGVSFIGCRQTEPNFEVETSLIFQPVNKESAGLVVMQASNHQLKIQITQKNEQNYISLIQVTTEINCPPHLPQFKSKTMEVTLVQHRIDSNNINIKVTGEGQNYTFYYKKDEELSWSLLGMGDGRLINPEIVGCMVGTLIGIFASSEGVKSTNSLIISKFLYQTIC